MLELAIPLSITITVIFISQKLIKNYIQKEVKKILNSLNEENKKLKKLAEIDGLTGAYNKTTFLKIADNLIKSKQKFSLIVFDIDNFKRINDTVGHMAGDSAIITLADTIRNNIRDNDLFCRFGGDEFIVLFPDINKYKISVIADKLREQIELNHKFTVSIGATTYNRKYNNINELIELADKGLYKSKQKGKNAVSYIEA